MQTNEFEEAFSNFLDRHEYDEAEHYLFSMVRLAFSAGWQAAGGAPPKAERIFEVIFPAGREDGEETVKKEADPIAVGSADVSS